MIPLVLGLTAVWIGIVICDRELQVRKLRKRADVLTQLNDRMLADLHTVCHKNATLLAQQRETWKQLPAITLADLPCDEKRVH